MKDSLNAIVLYNKFLEGVDILHQHITGNVLELDIVQETSHLLPFKLKKIIIM